MSLTVRGVDRHAETVLVEYDPKRVKYEELLLAFWDTHDPTTENRQGPDVGDQYRSAIFTTTKRPALSRARCRRGARKPQG